ncbi:MAG: hypothetical protein ACNYPG_00630 [Candidatus Porifericomitaceae bacterium WSBS_2022_MAG_OTU9]
MAAAVVVVKIGGSLMDSPQLCLWLKAVQCRRAVLVPGGGAFADAVRIAQGGQAFADEAAHEMAILAMWQFGIMCCSLHHDMKLFTTVAQGEKILAAGLTPVWCPHYMAMQWQDLPHNWSVTADTLSLRLAAAMGAGDLILVKSAPPKIIGQVPADGIIDEAFAGQYIRYGEGIKLHQYGANDYEELMFMAEESRKKNPAALNGLPGKHKKA